MKSATLPLGENARLDGVRVLVVDDAPYVLEMVTEVLERGGAMVTAVGSAEEALCGYWLIGQVRALSPERGGATPAAALTAYAGPEHRASVLRAGFQSHVEKPAGVRELVGIVAGLAQKE
jgi:CheY-like chemotaxis protein